MPLPFRAFKVRGDGSLHFVKEAETFEDARDCAGELAEIWPGEYVIQNEETGERGVITSGSKPTN
jgi:hypothetical protein